MNRAKYQVLSLTIGYFGAALLDDFRTTAGIILVILSFEIFMRGGDS